MGVCVYIQRLRVQTIVAAQDLARDNSDYHLWHEMTVLV